MLLVLVAMGVALKSRTFALAIVRELRGVFLAGLLAAWARLPRAVLVERLAADCRRGGFFLAMIVYCNLVPGSVEDDGVPQL